MGWAERAGKALTDLARASAWTTTGVPALERGRRWLQQRSREARAWLEVWGEETREDASRRWQHLRHRASKRWTKLRAWSVRQWNIWRRRWGENWKELAMGVQLLGGWALVTWAAAELVVWIVEVAGGPTAAVPGIVWKASGGCLILGLVGRQMLSKLFGYGPYLLDEMDRQEQRRRQRER